MLETGNKRVVLVVGKPAAGKTASLRNINDPSVAYLNVDRKDLPFPDNFTSASISDPSEMLSGLDFVNSDESIKGVVIDTLTFAMEQYENQVVRKSTNTQTAWGDYASFYNDIIDRVKASDKHYAIFAHIKDEVNEAEVAVEQRVSVKGGIGKRGVNALALLH